MHDPLTFLCQPSPKPVVPIRMAIIGPPKSGKSTRKLMSDMSFGSANSKCFTQRNGSYNNVYIRLL